MSKRIGELLAARFERKPARLSARVTSVPVDATGKPLNYVLCEVGGQAGIRAATLPGLTLYPGDAVLIEGQGGAATTRYSVAGVQAGIRPDSGSFEVTSATTVGNLTLEPGDILWGNPFGAHFQYDYSAGQIIGATGTQIGLVLDAAGVIQIGDPAGVHQRQTPTGIEWRNGEAVLAALDAAGRTIYGFERLGQPHGPALEWGEVEDEATGESRFALRVLGANGAVGVALRTGTQSAPDDYEFVIGREGAAERLVYADGALTISATTGGKTATLAAGALKLQGTASTHWVNLDVAASYPVSVGHASSGSAPFRVSWTGEVYATKLMALSGSAAVGSGNYLIDVEGTGSSANGVRGTGDAVGVRGVGNQRGVDGYSAGGTGAVGVRGESATGTGVSGIGAPGVYAEAQNAGDDALVLAGGPLAAGGQDIVNTRYVYIGGSTCYLYLSGTDIYWYNGSTGVKLN